MSYTASYEGGKGSRSLSGTLEIFARMRQHMVSLSAWWCWTAALSEY